jgi:uncharacterized glyoxalase superfamily protein PhnB
MRPWLRDTPPMKSLTPMLRTWDMPASIAFYRDILGFRCEAQDEGTGWASLERDGVAIMLSGPNEHLDEKAPAFTGSLYIRTDDVAALWEALNDRARVCYPLEDFDHGMREFAIYDNNGYLLQFGEEIVEH